jgi:integrase
MADQTTSYQNDLVFTSPTGLPTNNVRFSNQVWKGGRNGNKNYKGIVTQLVKEGKVERYRCLYNTRHTFITMALEAGVTVPQVAKLVGNSPEVTMRHYAGNLLKMEVPVF